MIDPKVREFMQQAIASDFPDLRVAGEIIQDLAETLRDVERVLLHRDYEEHLVYVVCRHCNSGAPSVRDIKHIAGCCAYIPTR